MNHRQISDIRELSFEEIKTFVLKNNEKEFRAKQIYEWLWQKGITSLDEMSNISKETRQVLKDNFVFNSLTQAAVQKSKDRTVKIAYRLWDSEIIETVLIPSKDRVTVCISTQVGCAMGCKFCATGTMKLHRNLSTGEIFDQVAFAKKQAQEYYHQNLSNIVIMGMGEPMSNYGCVMRAIDKITSTDGLGISAQRITLSTIGIPKMIKQFADDYPRIQLAVSLHTANDFKRTHLMPINQKNNIKDLTEALKYYHRKTGERISFEYLIIGNFNDGISDAKELAEFCKNFPVKINIIEYNEIKGTQFKRAEETKVQEFVKYLESKNILVQIRNSKGNDIDAACGQLAGKLK